MPAEVPAQEKGKFPTTKWSLVARIQSHDEAVAAKALEQLCTQYHYPLYCYLRRRGCTHHDAQDVLHDFLLLIFRRRSLDNLEQSRGRLRGWLSTSLSRHFADWRRSESRRGLGAHSADDLHFEHALDFTAIEDRYCRERFRHDDSPDRVFDREWAIELLRHVLDALGEKYAQRGREAVFAALRPVVEAGGSLRQANTAALAAPLGMNEEAVRQALARLMREFRDAARVEVRLTVERDEEVRDEITHLLALFRRE